MATDRYGSDVLAGDWRVPKNGRTQPVEATVGDVVEEVMTGWCGEIVRIDRDLGTLDLEDRHGKRRTFPLGPGFHLDGKPVELTRPARKAPIRSSRTASGSLAVDTVARVARASRIWVEGRHDAELVEKVWGDDLRVEGVVVEYLEGVDHLDERLREFGPDSSQRVGVLVDHLVPGSKESRIGADIARGPLGGAVLIVGHPYIDIWQAVRPDRVGLKAWPTIPRDISWKAGVCAALGWPHGSQSDIARAWQQILSRVTSYTDLEPELLGRVEQLIDFVTVD
ncbi:MAG TPA: DUF3097 domain-containing protein [Nocardioidaceae bacterium]|nr:DUF3097 domain-containing protein [Nocardioidaceae bacterium]